MGDAGSRGQLRRGIILYFHFSLFLPIIYIIFDMFFHAMGTVYATLSIAMSILGALLSPVRGGGESCGRAHSLLKVSASRARVLCPTCHSENDDGYHFCQWCGNAVSAHCRQTEGKGPLTIDEEAISSRCKQFTAAWAEKASTRVDRRHGPCLADF